MSRGVKMEWNQEQIQFLLDNKALINEAKDFTKVWDASGDSNLDLLERKHLLLGIALAAGLEIIAEIKNKTLESRLYVFLNSQNKIVIGRWEFDDTPTDSQIFNLYLSDIISKLGASRELAEKVMGKVKLRRVG
jgi:hypothetical protein